MIQLLEYYREDAFPFRCVWNIHSATEPFFSDQYKMTEFIIKSGGGSGWKVYYQIPRICRLRNFGLVSELFIFMRLIRGKHSDLASLQLKT